MIIEIGIQKARFEAERALRGEVYDQILRAGCSYQLRELRSGRLIECTGTPNLVVSSGTYEPIAYFCGDHAQSDDGSEGGWFMNASREQFALQRLTALDEQGPAPVMRMGMEGDIRKLALEVGSAGYYGRIRVEGIAGARYVETLAEVYRPSGEPGIDEKRRVEGKTLADIRFAFFGVNCDAADPSSVLEWIRGDHLYPPAEESFARLGIAIEGILGT